MELVDIQQNQQNQTDLLNKNKINTVIDGIQFWSNFDSGNLQKVEQQSENFFNLTIAKESCKENGRTCWFYFKILSKKNVSLNLTVVNIENSIFTKQFQEGKQILIKQKGKKVWSSVPVKQFQAKEQNLLVEFEVELQENIEYSLAFAQPWSYQHNQKWLDTIQKEFSKNKDIYFNREIIVHSTQGNQIELITISSSKNILKNQQEDLIDPDFLFPDSKNRPLKFQNKKYILIGARIHASETPANYILRGIINFLQDQSQGNQQNRQTFLDNYVLCFIPILNPDGVIQGNYRLDYNGNDLNRKYNECLSRKKLYPGNYAIMKLAQNLDQQDKLFAYFDLHAHVNYQGGFIFGNTHNSTALKAEMRIIPKILSIMVPCFKFQQCGFKIAKNEDINSELDQSEHLHPEKQQLKYSIPNKIIEDFETEEQQRFFKFQEQIQANGQELSFENQEKFQKREIQRENIKNLQGVGKTDIFLTTSLILSYTVEANHTFYTKKDSKSGFIKKYRMGISDFDSIGRGIAMSLLEYEEIIDPETSIFFQKKQNQNQKNNNNNEQQQNQNQQSQFVSNYGFHKFKKVQDIRNEFFYEMDKGFKKYQ